MKLEKRVKQRIDNNLNQVVKNPYKNKARFPFWAKIAIPVSSVALTAAIALGVFIPLLKQNEPEVQLQKIAAPKRAKTTTKLNTILSSKTYNSYFAFAQKFTTLVMETNNVKDEKSLGISIPDAYLCLAVLGVISDQDALNDILDYLELSSLNELRNSVKEIVTTLGTLFKNSDGKLSGGYNLNSVWIDPNQMELLKEKDEELYKDLEEVFDASIYYETLTTKRANQYLKEEGLEGYPVPEIELNDSNPDALDVMSTYYCLDYFEEEMKDTYRAQYKKGTHKMDFTYNGVTSKVDYIGRFTNGANVYEGSDFYGADLSIQYLGMRFFLPKDENALPSTILDDVLKENYELKTGVYTDPKDNQEKETNRFDLTVQAPYFSLNNEVSLNHPDLVKELPHITSKGAGARIAKSKSNDDIYLDYIKQFSVMKFNYDGFYSCSVTIAGGKATSVEPISFPKFDLILNHPYIFEVKKGVFVSGSDKYVYIPIVIGEIVTPEYKD